MHWQVRGLSCKPNIYVSWSTSEFRVRLAPLNRFKPSSKIFYWPFQGGTSFVDLLCFCSVLCLLCLCARLFMCALWSPAGKGWPLGSRLWCLLWVCHFPIGILGQVWYLIVLIPDLCTHTYFGWIFLGLLSHYEDDPDDLIKGVVTQDETWVHYFDHFDPKSSSDNNGSTLAHPLQINLRGFI